MLGNLYGTGIFVPPESEIPYFETRTHNDCILAHSSSAVSKELNDIYLRKPQHILYDLRL